MKKKCLKDSIKKNGCKFKKKRFEAVKKNEGYK